MYVIVNLDTGCYVTASGWSSSYTDRLQQARVFYSYAEAERDCCGNECVRSITECMDNVRR